MRETLPIYAGYASTTALLHRETLYALYGGIISCMWQLEKITKVLFFIQGAGNGMLQANLENNFRVLCEEYKLVFTLYCCSSK